MRLLIIEDNKQVVMALQRGLRSAYAIDVAYNGQDGLLQAMATSYDVILLDLTLPDMSGEDICRTLRAERRTMPIVIITAATEVVKKVTLLDMGADDFLTKPCSLEEIRARLRAVLRRSSQRLFNTLLVVEDLELDTAARTVTRQGQAIQLRRKEFDLLEYLMLNAGRTVTRPMIIEHVWDMNENLWTNAVDVHIKHLRDRVDKPFGKRLIRTVHGVGYKIETSEAKEAEVSHILN